MLALKRMTEDQLYVRARSLVGDEHREEFLVVIKELRSRIPRSNTIRACYAWTGSRYYRASPRGCFPPGVHTHSQFLVIFPSEWERRTGVRLCLR